MLAEIRTESYVSDSDLAERAFALFPREEWIYTMLSYFDESTQDREAYPASCVSALTGTGLQWSKFSHSWAWILEEFDVRDRKGRRVFHATDFETPEGQIGTSYENWEEEDPDKRKRFNRALCDAIADSGVQVSAASVLLAEYEEVASKVVPVILEDGEVVSLPRDKAFGDKYAFCAFWALMFAAEEARHYPKGTDIACYFESGGGYQHQIETVYELASQYDTYVRFFEKPNFVSKDFAVALQAADKMAYECSKHISHMRHPNPPLKYSHVEDGKPIWKTRFALRHLVINRVDVNIRHWFKEDIEAFFVEGEERIAKRIADRQT